jgi:pre-mRNA-splicing factor 18
LNDFRRVMEHMEQGLNVEDAVKRLLGQNGPAANNDGKDKADQAAEGQDEEQLIDLDLIKTDPDKLYPLIYYAIKRKLKEWEQSMAERPGAAR